jgi:TolB protein
LAPFAAAFLGACASFNPLASDSTSEPAGATTEPAKSAGAGSHAAASVSPPPAAPTSATADEPVSHPQPKFVGLYGELDGMEAAHGLNAAGAAAIDGSTNFAQVTAVTEGACADPDIDRSGRWLVFSSTMHRPTSDLYLKSIAGKTVTQLTSDPADDAMPCFSPDGQRLAFTSNRGGNWDIYVMGVDGGQPTQLTTGPEHEMHPTWSPDGTLLAYCKLGSQSGRWEIWVADAANPGVRHFLDYGLFPQWCPDPARSKLLFQKARQRGSRYHGIWTIDYVAGEAMHPTEIVSAANAATINPTWSPDGSMIAFVAVVEPDSGSAAAPQQADVWIVNIDGSGRTNLTNGRFANFQPAWATDGRVYFVSNRSSVDNIWAVTTERAVAAARGSANAAAFASGHEIEPAHVAGASTEASDPSAHH